MSHALAVAGAAPVFTCSARAKGMPLTGTVERVPAPLMLKQASGSPGTSGEGSAHAAAANSRVARMARASMRTTMIAAGHSPRGGRRDGGCLTISGEIDGFARRAVQGFSDNTATGTLSLAERAAARPHPAGAVLLLGEKSGMIIGSNNEDIDFHR